MKTFPAPFNNQQIDKLCLEPPLSSERLMYALDTAKSMQHEGTFTRGSIQGTFFKHAFVQQLPSRGIFRVHLVPTQADSRSVAQFIFNPNHLTNDDVIPIIGTIKRLLGLPAIEIARGMLIRRIDSCLTVHVPVDDLIIDLSGARVGSKFFVQTDAGGKQQTIYAGSPKSEHHGIAYDQNASDEYKRAVGEITSRSPFADNADLALTASPDRTRLESRRRFKQPVSLSALADITHPFDPYRIYQINFSKESLDIPFLNYIDSVRLRGVFGARKYLLASSKGNREAKSSIAGFEAKLQALAAPWWKPKEYGTSLIAILRRSPAWRIVRVMEGASAYQKKVDLPAIKGRG